MLKIRSEICPAPGSFSQYYEGMALEQSLQKKSLRRQEDAPTDPRWLRSRESLTEAVIALAQEQPISSVSVYQLTRRAGVSRATFYNHADSPQALLVSVLRCELEELFSVFHLRLLDNHGYMSRVQDYGIRSIAEHVKTRQCLYRNSLKNDNMSLIQSVLADYLVEKSRVLMDESQYRFAIKAPENAFEREFAVRVACAGLVGGIMTWLNESENPNVDDFMAAYYISFPVWFTMTGQAYE